MKNFKKLSVALMLALGTTFAMTSCGEATEEPAHTDAADAVMGDVDAEAAELIEAAADAAAAMGDVAAEAAELIEAAADAAAAMADADAEAADANRSCC